MLANFVVWYLVFLFSLTFHEYAHARVAAWGGDGTAYSGGFVTLDPTPHVLRSPVGLVLIPLLSYFQSGWMIGWASVPYDPIWGSRYPKRQAFMSAAGPLANLVLALCAFVLLKFLLSRGTFVPNHQLSFGDLVTVVDPTQVRSPLGAAALALGILLDLNLALALFNLIPAPPLDGAGILEGLFPKQLGSLFAQLRGSGIGQILVLVLLWQGFPYILSPVRYVVLVALFS